MVDIEKTRQIFDVLVTNKLSDEDFKKLFDLASNVVVIEDEYAYALKIAAIYTASKNKDEQIDYEKNIFEQMYRDYVQQFYADKDDPSDDKSKYVIRYVIE